MKFSDDGTHVIDYQYNNVKSLSADGHDQSNDIQDWINNNDVSVFNSGDFILKSSIIIHSKHIDNKTGYGQGLTVLGHGPGLTRFLDCRTDKSTALITITDPTGSAVNKRNLQAFIYGLSVVACDPTTHEQLSATEGGGTGVSGYGVAIQAVTGSGLGAHVLHMGEFERFHISGYQYAVVLDDVTQLTFKDSWFQDNSVGLFLGGNCDHIKLDKSFIGSEDWANAPRRNQIGVKNGYTNYIGEGVGTGVVSGMTNLMIENTLVQHIGTIVHLEAPGDLITLRNVYPEDVTQYVTTKQADNSVSLSLSMEGCNFNFLGDTDTTKPKIDMGSGVDQYVSVKNCISESTLIAPFIKCTNALNGVTLSFEGNHIPPDESFGHYQFTNDVVTYTLNLNKAKQFQVFGGKFGLKQIAGATQVYDWGVANGYFIFDVYKGKEHLITINNNGGNLTLVPDTGIFSASQVDGFEITLVITGAASGATALVLNSDIDTTGYTAYESGTHYNKVTYLNLRWNAARSLWILLNPNHWA